MQPTLRAGNRVTVFVALLNAGTTSEVRTNPFPISSFNAYSEDSRSFSEKLLQTLIQRQVIVL